MTTDIEAYFINLVLGAIKDRQGEATRADILKEVPITDEQLDICLNHINSDLVAKEMKDVLYKVGRD